jgi:peptidoglycan/LPS O-acetylase OafA/YrhL
VLSAGSGRIAALDALRGLAVLMVTLYHLGGTYPGPAASGAVLFPALESCTHGVDLFFVLSGFLITGILHDTRRREGYFAKFFARRSLRIFPLYYGVLFVVLWALPWIGMRTNWQAEAASHSPWLLTYGTNLLIAIRGEWCLGALDHFWSLAIEEQFYLLWPLVILWLSRERAMALCVCLMAGAALGRFLWVVEGGDEVARYVLTPFRVDALAAGAWIALYLRGGMSISALGRAARITLAIVSLLLLPISVYHLRLLSLTDDLWTIECAALLIVVLAAAQGTAFESLGKNRCLQWVGHYSYGIYVFGNLLIALFAPLVSASGLSRLLGSAYAGQLAYALILGAATVGAAVLSWHLYEKHFVRLKARFAESAAWENRQPASQQGRRLPACLPEPQQAHFAVSSGVRNELQSS